MPKPRRTRAEVRLAGPSTGRPGDRISYPDGAARDDPARSYTLIHLHRMELAGVEIDAAAVAIATRLGHHAYEQAQVQPIRTDESLRARALEVQAASRAPKTSKPVGTGSSPTFGPAENTSTRDRHFSGTSSHCGMPTELRRGPRRLCRTGRTGSRQARNPQPQLDSSRAPKS